MKNCLVGKIVIFLQLSNEKISAVHLNYKKISRLFIRGGEMPFVDIEILKTYIKCETDNQTKK